MKVKRLLILVLFIFTVFYLIGCEKKHTKDEILLQPVAENNYESTQEDAGKDFQVKNDVEDGMAGADLERQGREEASCFVHICGAVVNPGVYELPQGSRVFEVVKEAGGFREDACTDYVNQASIVEDGSKISIPTLGEVEQAKEAGLTFENDFIKEKEPEDDRININTANASTLCTLPGVGEAKAASIIAYREKQGSFTSVEDIMKVEGVKDGLFQKIKDKIKV